MLFPVLLSGGIGSRLWPLSREHYPKQLLALHGESTMLQNTAQRVAGLPDLAPPIVVCNEAHRFLVLEQLDSLGTRAQPIVLEPFGKNTAPATAIAAWVALEKDPEAYLLVLPADHLVGRPERFREAVSRGLPAAAQGKLVTFGIVPHRPETGYGYIRKSLPTAHPEVYEVDRFVEKPDRDTAAGYLASGDYLWNSGMFLFRADRFLAELRELAPTMHDTCKMAQQQAALDLDNEFLRLDAEHFSACPADSIDYAVMEKTANATVVPLDAEWNDIGSWPALWEVGDADPEGNVSQGDIINVNSRGCYLRSQHRLVAAVGLDDAIVVETADAVLVAHKDQAQQVKKVVDQLKTEQREEADLHRKVFRPWGTYENLDVEERFKVKRIMVNPGASLSLQLHYHRSEHWVVVKGTARITRGEETFVLSENQSTYISLGTPHRLENPGQLPLEIIEIQSGTYLGEDDIVRLEDNYGRHDP